MVLQKRASFIKIEKIDGVFKYVSFIDREQTELDYKEVLFYKIEKGIFYYKRNHSITLDVHKAFIKKGAISILAPEIILLHKSRNSENNDYQNDYEMVIDTLDEDRYEWFMHAMKTEYPNGHKWIR